MESQMGGALSQVLLLFGRVIIILGLLVAAAGRDEIDGCPSGKIVGILHASGKEKKKTKNVLSSLTI